MMLLCPLPCCLGTVMSMLGAVIRQVRNAASPAGVSGSSADGAPAELQEPLDTGCAHTHAVAGQLPHCPAEPPACTWSYARVRAGMCTTIVGTSQQPSGGYTGAHGICTLHVTQAALGMWAAADPDHEGPRSTVAQQPGLRLFRTAPTAQVWQSGRAGQAETATMQLRHYDPCLMQHHSSSLPGPEARLQVLGGSQAAEASLGHDGQPRAQRLALLHAVAGQHHRAPCTPWLRLGGMRVSCTQPRWVCHIL